MSSSQRASSSAPTVPKRLKQDLICKNKIFLLAALDLNIAVMYSSYTSLRMQNELGVVNNPCVCRA